MTTEQDINLHESLSALVDGEHNDFDLQRVLNALDEPGSAQTGDSGRSENGAQKLRGKWSRYQSVSALIKKESAVDLSLDLASSVREAIEKEVNQTVSEGGAVAASASRWWNWAGKTAVAASVTLGVLFASQQYVLQQGESTVIAATDSESSQASGAVVPQGFNLPPLSARTVSTDSFVELPQGASSLPRGTVVVSNEAFKEQVDRLLFKHAEKASSAGAMGAIPFARVSELESDNLAEGDANE